MYALFMDVMFYAGGIQGSILCCVETTFALVSISGIVAGPTVWQWLLGAALRSTPPSLLPSGKTEGSKGSLGLTNSQNFRDTSLEPLFNNYIIYK